jgi:SAM-dependent methyltransferase
MSQTIAREYYDNYQSGSWDLQLQVELIERVPGYFPDTALQAIRSKPEAHYLLLGSAAPRNFGHMACLNRVLRPWQGEHDTVTLVDSNPYSVNLHKKEIEDLEEWHKNVSPLPPSDKPPLIYPQLVVREADMRATGLNDNSVDVAVSDYTFNFLPNIEDVSAAFAEVSRVLKADGTFLIALCGHKQFRDYQENPVPAPEPALREMVGATAYEFPLGTYLGIAREQGLELATQPFLCGADMSSGVLRPAALLLPGVVE